MLKALFIWRKMRKYVVVFRANRHVREAWLELYFNQIKGDDHMRTAHERILTINLMRKINKDPNYARKLGIVIEEKEGKENERIDTVRR